VKDFMGREQLPFKLFGMNGAYYYVQVITHFLCECYKEDVGAADKAAIQLVKVQPYQLLVSDT